MSRRRFEPLPHTGCDDRCPADCDGGGRYADPDESYQPTDDELAYMEAWGVWADDVDFGQRFCVPAECVVGDDAMADAA